MVLLINLDDNVSPSGYTGYDSRLLDSRHHPNIIDATGSERAGCRGRISSNVTTNTDEATGKQRSDDGGKERENPNLNEFSAALGCYPIVSQITYSLDLNTLHALAQTCRQFRANLLQFRRQLVTQTLRCENEEADSLLTEFYSNSYSKQPWGRAPLLTRSGNGVGPKTGQLTSGKNCIIKAPSTHRLTNRHRRLCDTCLSAPLYKHTTPRSMQPLPEPPSFTAEAFLRGPCNCPESVWLCLPCGQAIASSDTTYRRGWAWRTSYGTRLFGLGTGIGEGIHGVHCGRETECLAAKEAEFENDCDVQVVQQHSTERGELGPSYLRQEIEGIGGVVKQKVKKRLRVGAIVKAHDDEMNRREYLGREERGEERSWCGWCSRVIPSVKDRQRVSWA
ncbi:hypothetical protein L228DRAFT_271629 [Xylona heveae TC161]|uniref:F-box domain-containing protein n=1 Tax=Xylona heveae (strain CBS 132557 / TC161) TaxID=1328760 RepID=A0A164ZEJ4_XYLHT|nr:hypothetical protein L228DRAFT_271629 [Xylona heveae TC161]KZF19002.1 hypothetical protein L228DRAFT_271629 [Xylona heveae TC161]